MASESERGLIASEVVQGLNSEGHYHGYLT